MPIWTTPTTVTDGRVDTRGWRRSVAELVLAYGVWGLGLALMGPLGDMLGGSGGNLAIVLVYPLLIQLPLAIHYDRALGFSAGPDTRWRFLGARLFHPVLVYGLFVLLFVDFVGLVTGTWGPLAAEPATAGELIGNAIAYIIVVVLGYAALLAYFPIVVLAALLLKWGQWAGRRLLTSLGSVVGRTRAPAPRPDRTEHKWEEEEEESAVGGDQPGTDAPAADPGATPETGDESPLADPRNVRFASLLGLVLIPIGAGLFAGRPEFGISVASLLLTVYQLSYNPQATGE